MSGACAECRARRRRPDQGGRAGRARSAFAQDDVRTAGPSVRALVEPFVRVPCASLAVEVIQCLDVAVHVRRVDPRLLSASCRASSRGRSRATRMGRRDDRKPPWSSRLMKPAATCSGQIAQQRRRAQNHACRPKERHGDAIAAEMPVHENGPIWFSLSDAESEGPCRTIAGLPALGAEALANRIAYAIDARARSAIG